MVTAENKGRLVPAKDLGATALLRSLPSNQSRLPLGRVYGKANRLIVRNMPTGESYGGFSGIFEAQPYSNKYPTVRAPLLFLPHPVAKLLRGPLEKIKTENKRDTLAFRFEVSLVRSDDNPQGYVLEYSPVGTIAKAEPIDILADVRSGFPLRVLTETVPPKANRVKRKIAR